MKFIERLPFIILALIPASLGILAMINNLSQFNPTMHNVIIPMLSMSDVTNTYARAMRAINHPTIIYIAFCFVMTLEFLVGLFASIGLVKIAHSTGKCNFKK